MTFCACASLDQTTGLPIRADSNAEEMNIRRLYNGIGKDMINGRREEKGKKGGEEYDNDDAEKGRRGR